MTDEQRKKYYAKAKIAYRESNDKRWVFAYWASKIVGKYGRGGTIGLADFMSVSEDTVEDHAHAYWMYDKLRKMGDEAEKLYVQTARGLSYIYYSHFRALWDLQNSRHLTDEQVMNLLVDIVQADGKISSRNLENHVNSKHGDTRTWDFYGAKALKELNKTYGQPDLPNNAEFIGNLYAVAFDVDGETVRFYVIAYNEPRAEAIARKQLATLLGKPTDPEHNFEFYSNKCIENTMMDKVLTDSKNILGIASSWLGDNA